MAIPPYDVMLTTLPLRALSPRASPPRILRSPSPTATNEDTHSRGGVEDDARVPALPDEEARRARARRGRRRQVHVLRRPVVRQRRDQRAARALARGEARRDHRAARG